MEIIPAIDLKNGKCVRLLQGRDEQTTEYSADPVSIAQTWVTKGARRIHVVNLDGAFGRASGNLDIVRKMTQKVDAVIEFGGGLRSMPDIEKALEAGVQKVVLGTIAVTDQDLVQQLLRRIGTNRVVVALDAVGGKVATKGWTSVTTESVLDVAREMEEIGVSEVLYTDIQRDGMMIGPDMETLTMLSESTGLKVIASGGVSSHEDVLGLARLGLQGITGVIIGKALYERRIDLELLLKQVETC